MPCRADTSGPADEVTGARKVMGLGVGLYVAAGREADAREIIAALRARAAATPDEDLKDAPEA